jgi:hypothetical protein
MLRAVTIACCTLGTILTALVAMSTLGRVAEPATHGFDLAAGYAVLGLFLLTSFPAALLSWRRRSPRLALALSLAFPATFALLLLAAIIAFA